MIITDKLVDGQACHSSVCCKRVRSTGSSCSSCCGGWCCWQSQHEKIFLRKGNYMNYFVLWERFIFRIKSLRNCFLPKHCKMHLLNQILWLNYTGTFTTRWNITGLWWHGNKIILSHLFGWQQYFYCTWDKYFLGQECVDTWSRYQTMAGKMVINSERKRENYLQIKFCSVSTVANSDSQKYF